MYILYLITSGCRWKTYDPSTPLGSCFQFSSLSCFSHPWLSKTNAHAFCSSFGYRYYSTRCWLVRHQLLTTNRWNKILRIHSGYDLSSGAVCRFCDSFLDSDHDDRWWCLWNLHDDFSFYHAGKRMWLLTYLIGTPSKTKKEICISASICLTCPTQIQRRPPTRLVKRCTALYLFKQKIETIIPGKKALTALRKTSVNKNSRTSSQDLNENFTQSSKKDLIEGIWQDLCTRTSWRLPLQTFIQAPSRSSRKYLLEDSSRMCARSPYKHLYNKGFH